MRLLEDSQYAWVQSPLPAGQLLSQALHVEIQKSGDFPFPRRQTFPRQQLLHDPFVGPAGNLQTLQPLGNAMEFFHGMPESCLPRFAGMKKGTVDVPEQKFPGAG